jgi:ABC-type antimicrobial peptide transport system permease subunit
MFVIEGSIIGILGGIAGVLLGFILSWGINLLGGVYIRHHPEEAPGTMRCLHLQYRMHFH